MTLLTDIVTLVRSSACQKINFQFESIRVYGEGFKTIADNIERGHIQIISSPTFRSDRSLYHGDYKCIVANPEPEKNVIVHECVHALNDWHKRRILAIDSEASAYIAQCMYMILVHDSVNLIVSEVSANNFAQRCGINPSLCQHAIFNIGWVIARIYLNKKKPSIKHIMQLRNAIQRDPLYINSASNREINYTGVRRTSIPQTYLDQTNGTIVGLPVIPRRNVENSSTSNRVKNTNSSFSPSGGEPYITEPPPWSN